LNSSVYCRFPIDSFLPFVHPSIKDYQHFDVQGFRARSRFGCH
jgi:hypothetical protein